MSEPIWLDVDEVIDMHAEQLAIFGGPEGIRDRGLLEFGGLAASQPMELRTDGYGCDLPQPTRSGLPVTMPLWTATSASRSTP